MEVGARTCFAVGLAEGIGELRLIGRSLSERSREHPDLLERRELIRDAVGALVDEIAVELTKLEAE